MEPGADPRQLVGEDAVAARELDAAEAQEVRDGYTEFEPDAAELLADLAGGEPTSGSHPAGEVAPRGARPRSAPRLRIRQTVPIEAGGDATPSP